MSEPKPLASLSPSLLARKGGAKPAMRPQVQPLPAHHDGLARVIDDDLGWNDMGHDHHPDDHHHHDHQAPVFAPEPAPVVPMQAKLPVAPPSRPVVLEQQEEVARRVAAANPAKPASDANVRRSALSDGRRAAFTLRVDAERHLRLRLACTLRNRSAQQLVTEALDKLLNELPELSDLASQVSRQRK